MILHGTIKTAIELGGTIVSGVVLEGDIQSSINIRLQQKSVTPTNRPITVYPDVGYDGLSSVTVAQESEKVINLQEKRVTPSNESQLIRADSGYDGLEYVIVEPIPPDGIEYCDEVTF